MNNNLIQEYKKYQMGNFYRIIILIASIILGTCINIFFESTNYISKALQLHDIGTFITASLASPLSGIMCCLISSIINPMFNKAVSTYIFTFAAEIAVLIMSFFISKGWMKSLPKACLAGFLNVCITFAGVVINYIISGLSLMSALKFITRENLIKNFLYGMPIQFIVILIAYLAFNYLPDRVLVKLPHGIYYVRDEEFQAFIKAYHLKCRKQSIELKVYYGTAILVILLTFSASFSFNTLYFNDVAKLQGNNILQSIKEKKLIPDKKIDEESIDIDVIKQTINDGLPLIEWSEPEAPYKNLGFFLKFISMLLCIELAVVVICVNYLRHSIILPIISVSARASDRKSTRLNSSH